MFNQRPQSNEYAEYYNGYVTQVPEGDLIKVLEELNNKTVEFIKSITEEQGQFRYAPSKWSIKEVLGHIIDTEMIMSYRMLCIARGETVGLPGYDENDFVRNANFDRQSMSDLLERYTIVRKSTIQLLKSLSEESWLRRGVANNYEATVRAIATIIPGHELHHINVLEDRYIKAETFPKK
ncbi:DinB family protein [Peribacillus alkalitolerans]|uniref:DinB family protein n=1 Tax=Peribacillus alkalitolerans TaxID=1550385 RepID=UPI0013D6E132|nr:DinB family protein [Peribacillus alkalitolerans]